MRKGLNQRVKHVWCHVRTTNFLKGLLPLFGRVNVKLYCSVSVARATAENEAQMGRRVQR